MGTLKFLLYEKTKVYIRTTDSDPASDQGGDPEFDDSSTHVDEILPSARHAKNQRLDPTNVTD